MFAITAAIPDRALQERGVCSIGRADYEAITRRVVSDITAAIPDRALQERGVFSIRRANCEAIIRRVVSDTAAESLTALLNAEMIEREPGAR